jgi:hypothetical protein
MSADKAIRLYDFYSGECLTKVAGHSELVTGLAFTRDCKRLISVSGDGCIFVWKLAPEITKNIRERFSELTKAKRGNASAVPSKRDSSIMPDSAGKLVSPTSESSIADAIMAAGMMLLLLYNSCQAAAKAEVNVSLDTSRIGLEQVLMDFKEESLPAWAQKATGKQAPKNNGKQDTGSVRGRWKQVSKPPLLRIISTAETWR